MLVRDTNPDCDGFISFEEFKRAMLCTDFESILTIDI
jgi:hypothetical protein